MGQGHVLLGVDIMIIMDMPGYLADFTLNIAP